MRRCLGQRRTPDFCCLPRTNGCSREHGESDRREEQHQRYSTTTKREKIAETLGITTNTCRTHRKNLFRKIGCHSVASLIKKSTELGLL
ncbi:LuxR C-terminal-related transcriptional regulator [Sphingobacterium sp. 2149]|uniref:LuxR C-terminal-related transcriptional regulator n=1 Tax=Sphingobacterium sp. 2149 TaxID=2817763 RepID=UPI0038F706A5